ncbi:MAG TPA: endonuclease domain-containing protein [Candidatus Saccharimonadales bacterium]|nr:endonuclease domain-containing protein [Candidatus Saccharimonadales bacterium]
MKKCPRCGETKDDAEFYWRKGEDRIDSYCKPCRGDQVRERRAADPAGTAAAARAYRQTHRAGAKAAKRKWEKSHPAETRAAKRRRYHSDVERNRAIQKVWRNSHPEEVAARNAARREKHRAEGLYAWYRHGLSPTMRAELMARQDGKCAICRRDLAPLRKRTVDHDHVTNKIRGILCARCNGCLGWYELHREEAMAYLGATDQHLEPERRPSGRTEWKPF